MKRNATIKDVAQYAGVSTATVGRVIHGNGYVAEDTLKRVQEAIHATHYSVNSVAQSLRRQRTHIIGHILQSTFPNPFFVRVALGVEQSARSHGYHILTYNVQGSADAERQGVQTFIHRRVDAIIFTTPVDEANLELVLEAGIPAIQVERPLLNDVNKVVVDNYVGAEAAMEHLIELGHQRIAFIGQNLDYLPNPVARYVEHERLSAYLDVLSKYGLPYDQELIGMGRDYTLQDRDALGDGYRFTRQFLAISPRPMAIFASSDILAVGALQAIYEHRLRVPDHISVIGFDDTYASFVAPLLTTVRMPMEELGMAAVQIALEQLEQDIANYPPRTIKLATTLVVRSSTGPAAV